MPAGLNQRLEDLQTLGVRAVLLPFSFQFNGNSSPGAVTNGLKGYNASITLSTTGIYTLTIPRGLPEITAACVSNQSTTQPAQALSVGLVYANTLVNSVTVCTVQIRACNLGTTTLANVAADAGNRANLMLFVRQTGKAGI